MTSATRDELIRAFQNFDKWRTYGIAFGLMNQRKTTLREIKAIAEEHAGIRPDVIAMRRRDWINMAWLGSGRKTTSPKRCTEPHR